MEAEKVDELERSVPREDGIDFRLLPRRQPLAQRTKAERRTVLEDGLGMRPERGRGGGDEVFRRKGLGRGNTACEVDGRQIRHVVQSDIESLARSRPIGGRRRPRSPPRPPIDRGGAGPPTSEPAGAARARGIRGDATAYEPRVRRGPRASGGSAPRPTAQAAPRRSSAGRARSRGSSAPEARKTIAPAMPARAVMSHHSRPMVTAMESSMSRWPRK